MLSLTAAGRHALLAAHPEQLQLPQQLAAHTEQQQQLPQQLAAHTEQQQLVADTEQQQPPQLAAHTAQQLAALFHLETARFHTLFHEVRDMVRATEEAAACVGLSVKDTGALGKRTKYQVQ
jgi:hypothetical protein